MPNHPDAIGYLNDLANEVGEPWFKMVCDLAVGGGSSLDQNSCDTLFADTTQRVHGASTCWNGNTRFSRDSFRILKFQAAGTHTRTHVYETYNACLWRKRQR